MIITWQRAQQDDARMIADLATRDTSEADWKIGKIQERMRRRQTFASDRNARISPQVCRCGEIVDQLVPIYGTCDECVTDAVASDEISQIEF
jgi:hypothetical protein